MQIAPGSTDQSIYVYIVEDNAGASPGEPKTGLAFGDLDSVRYVREQAAAATVTPVTLASAAAAHSDGGFVEVDATNAPGLYRLDLPDAALAAGVGRVMVYVRPGNDSVASPIQIDLIAAAPTAQQVWEYGTRVLTAGTNLNDISAADVWAAGTRTLTAAGLDSIIIETGVTAPEALRAACAVLAGEASGLDTTMPVFKGINSATTRVSAVTDEDGNRSSVTLNL